MYSLMDCPEVRNKHTHIHGRYMVDVCNNVYMMCIRIKGNVKNKKHKKRNKQKPEARTGNRSTKRKNE